jgi:hypothetical protein
MKSIKIALAATGAVLFAAGCGSTGRTSSRAPAPASAAPPAAASYGPVDPSAASTRPGSDSPAGTSSSQPPKSGPPPPPAGLLQAVRAGRHTDYDRLVFQFGGSSAPTHRIRYVDQVRQDPSDRAVPLRGTAFLRVVFHGATLDTSPRESDQSKAQRYTGPSRVTPGLSLVKDVAVAGDFEGVLSFGVGLARPAGLRVQTLTAPARVVIDFWYEPPRQLLWPVTTLSQAWQLQRAVEEGHQPWVCGAALVVTFYAEAELGWTQPVVRALGLTVYQVSDPASHATAVVTVYQPARTGGPCGIWVIAAVAR